jgi:integrase
VTCWTLGGRALRIEHGLTRKALSGLLVSRRPQFTSGKGGQKTKQSRSNTPLHDRGETHERREGKTVKGIYKRGKVYWIRYAGPDGRTIRESSGSTKFSDAQDKLLDRKQAVKEGQHPETRRIPNHTFKELAQKYLAWIQGRHRSASTKVYRIKGGDKPSDKTPSMVDRFGALPLRRFNTLVVEKYQTDLMSRGLAPATVNKNLSILKAMFRKAVEWEMVEEETLKRVRSIKLLPENNRRLRFLSVEECQTLLGKCDAHLRPIVITALNTGLRKSTILNLRWDQVDLRHGFILLDRTKNGERLEIPINATLRATLQGLVRHLGSEYIFPDPRTGRPYQDVKNAFKAALKRAKIRDFKFHDLRHTFASHLVMAGVDLTTVKELLGHKSLTMTLRYAHLAPAHKVKAVGVLDGALTGSTAQLLHSGQEKGAEESPNPLIFMVGDVGFEPTTSAV